MTKIYLVRHCESEGNACRRAQAQFNGLVTAKGYAQNECLRRRFEKVHLDAIYSSDTFRSVMTAKRIAEEHGLPIKTRMLLREITTGVWEDMAWGDIPRRYPQEYAVWDSAPWELITPGGTTFQQAAALGIEGIRRIAREVGEGTALVISHSCTIKSMLCQLAGRPMSEVKKYGHGDNTSVNELEVAEDGTITVLAMSDSSHLPAELQRAWSGVAGADVNMSFETFDADSEEDMADYLAFRRQYAMEHSLPSDEAAWREEALRRMEKDGRFLAFSLLHDERSGVVELDMDGRFPPSAGHMVRHCIKPELQGKGYSDQLLGYAIHTFRLLGKHGIVLDAPETQEEKRVAHRFVVGEMEGFPGYLYLNTDVPSLTEPTLA